MIKASFDNTNFHILTIDFESWIFSKKIRKLNLINEELKKLDDGYTLFVLNYMLLTLRRHNQKITFFITSKIEDLYPGTIERIQNEGHEVGWHTHTHERVDNKRALIHQLQLAKKYIKKYNLCGFQAPEIVFFREGYKILKEFGFTYSSSIYGNSSHIYQFDGVFEIPVSTSNNNYAPKTNEIKFPSNLSFSNMLSYGIPYGSGFFFGILGKDYYSKKLLEASEKQVHCNLFLHDWQLVKPTSQEYKKDVSFFWNPLFLPYKIPVANLFEYLLAHFTFKPMGELLV